MKQKLKFYLFFGLGIIINIQAENGDNKGNNIHCVMKILFEIIEFIFGNNLRRKCNLITISLR